MLSNILPNEIKAYITQTGACFNTGPKFFILYAKNNEQKKNKCKNNKTPTKQ